MQVETGSMNMSGSVQDSMTPRERGCEAGVTLDSKTTTFIRTLGLFYMFSKYKHPS